MKISRLIVLIFCLGLVYTTGISQSVQYNVAEGSTMTVSGTSTLHDWTCEVKTIEGLVELDKKAIAEGKVVEGTTIDKVKITIPVKSIVSPRGATMDKKMHKALKMETNPEVTFELTDNKIASANGNAFSMNANGNLTVAGKTNAVEFPVAGELLSDGKLKFSGEYKFNMTTYDMVPPSAMYGQIVTGEDVVIKFELVVSQ